MKIVKLFYQLFLYSFILLTACQTTQKQPYKNLPDQLLDIIGKKIPNTTLKTSDGNNFQLAKTYETQPAILIFYRGGWCPYCNKHLGALQKIEKDLINMGFKIFAISPDKPQLINQTAQKEKLNYTLLSDTKMETAQALGISFKLDDKTFKEYKNYGIDIEESSGESHRLLPHPAVFIVDQNGFIKFAHINKDYKIRLQPEELLKAAQGNKKE